MNLHFLFPTFLNGCMSVLPFRILAYYLFRRQLRIPFPATVVCLIVLQLLQSAFYCSIITTHISAQWTDYIFAPIAFLFLFSCIKSDQWRILFQYIFILDYSISIRGISLVLEACLFHDPRSQTNILLSALVTLILFAVSFPLVVKIFKKSGDWAAGINAPFFWRTVWLLPTINTLIVLMYTSRITRENILKPQFLISRILLFLSMFLTYLILMRILDIIRKETVLEEQTAKQDQFLAAERTYMEQLERYLAKLRQAKHDTLQHLRIINSYIENNEYDALRKYIGQYEQSLPQNTVWTWCVNHSANILLSYYADECRSNGINFSAEALLPEMLPVAEPDFCSILGNLLENALTACREAAELSPYIKVRAKTNENQVVLTVDNTSSRPPKTEGDAFLSTKHEGSGIGTASVRAVAEKYHGNVQFSYRDHVFFASVLLFAQKDDSVPLPNK